jgi:hypothetical protein
MLAPCRCSGVEATLCEPRQQAAKAWPKQHGRNNARKIENEPTKKGEKDKRERAQVLDLHHGAAPTDGTICASNEFVALWDPVDLPELDRIAVRVRFKRGRPATISQQNGGTTTRRQFVNFGQTRACSTCACLLASGAIQGRHGGHLCVQSILDV